MSTVRASNVHTLPEPKERRRIATPDAPAPAYAELAVTTNFSFLRGGSHPEELVTRAHELGLAGLDIAEEVKSKGDLAKVQAAFNAWAKETGLPYTHLSRICALSVGENVQP